MKVSAPTDKATRTTWRTDVREIAEALGIPVMPDQWVILEAGDDYDGLPLTGTVDVVRWQRAAPATYQDELAERVEHGPDR
jgi:hypothetical protein